MARDRVVVAGSLAQKPGYAGHTWALAQYAIGFRDLGFDVLFLDRIESALCVDNAGRPCQPRESVNARYVVEAMREFGLSDRFSLIVDDGREWIGVGRRQAVEHVRDSVFLLNIMGFLKSEELLGAARCRVFLDIDPGFGQMWRALGLSDVFAGHDVHVTIGERIGEPDCEIPTGDLTWITTPPPVVLDRWPVVEARSRRFTTVASWRGAYGPVEYKGKTYGLRVHEFRKFVDLPRRSGQHFELALDIHPGERPDLERLVAGGWQLVDPARVAPDFLSYREYIQGSGAEFMVAKNMYVETRCGWMSDRSLCYLASGRPVLAQDTGWTALYPSEAGLVPFTTLDEAAAAARDVVANHGRHARAARAVAEEVFDSRKVLTRLAEAVTGSVRRG